MTSWFSDRLHRHTGEMSNMPEIHSAYARLNNSERPSRLVVSENLKLYTTKEGGLLVEEDGYPSLLISPANVTEIHFVNPTHEHDPW